MMISRIILKNWKNFESVDVPLKDRMFIVGPNAAGKSNFLDAFRFLRDIVKDGGGLQQAIKNREGISKVRCFSARKYPEISIEIHLSEHGSDKPLWKYSVGIKQEQRGKHLPQVSFEKAWRGNKLVCDRPDSDDLSDHERLFKTYIEQTNANKEFRDIAKYLEKALYLHLVPQLLKHPDSFTGPDLPGDPFGKSFLDRLQKTSKKTRDAWLRRIDKALRIAVPQLKGLHYNEEAGKPHLEALYEHWRPNAGKQKETQFSDGTLRLIALLWALQESDGILLLEEPELSLHSAVVAKIPAMIYRIQKERKRQVVITTHSFDLLKDRGVSQHEILLLEPSPNGTKIISAANKKEIGTMLESGMSPAEAIMPMTRPAGVEQLSFEFGK